MNSRNSNLDAQDSADLEALFDSVSSQAGRSATASPSAAAGDGTSQDRAFNRVGHIVRQLRDTLHELGYDKLIEKTVHAIPDTRDRLNYIASVTEQAASRVLNATDVAMPIQEKLQTGARSLGTRWQQLYANQLSVVEFKALASETSDFLLKQVPQQTEATNAQLMEIMMAQDFQDLTGQVIKKILALAQDLESQLMEVLVELIPDSRRNDEVNHLLNSHLLNGPVIQTANNTEVAVTQDQVDDLLESLGF